jgi:hypothetical protein
MTKAPFLFLMIVVLCPAGQAQTVRFSNPVAGVQFEYPARFRIVEQSQMTSGCGWFLTLLAGDEIVRINLTQDAFSDVASSEYFSYAKRSWTMDGKPARLVSRRKVKVLEGERLDSQGNDVVVTLAFVEHPHGCSAVLYTGSAGLRKTLVQIAESFRFAH